MSITMHRSKLSGHADAGLNRRVAEWLDNTINDYRNRGLTKGAAIRLAAASFGITWRRAKSIAFDESYNFKRTEEPTIKERYVQHIRDEIESLDQRKAALLERRRELGLPL